MAPIPNNSMAMKREVRGQFVTPQKRPIIPQAAHKGAGRPKRGAITQPRVAPVKKEGTISPPLKPAPSVIAVKRTFNINEYQGTPSSKH